MESSIHKINDRLFVNTIYVPQVGLTFNQFVLVGDDRKLVIIETGFRQYFKRLKENIEKTGYEIRDVVAVVALHFEADELGALAALRQENPKLAVYAHPICAFGINDVFEIKTYGLKDDETFTVAGLALTAIHTKHVHQWDSMVIYWSDMQALFSSDMFIQQGKFRGVVTADLSQEIENAIVDEAYLPSKKYLMDATAKLRKYPIQLILPMHGTALGSHVEKYYDVLDNVTIS